MRSVSRFREESLCKRRSGQRRSNAQQLAPASGFCRDNSLTQNGREKRRHEIGEDRRIGLGQDFEPDHLAHHLKAGDDSEEDASTFCRMIAFNHLPRGRVVSGRDPLARDGCGSLGVG